MDTTETLSRRKALRMFGGAVGGAAFVGGASGLLTPASAAGRLAAPPQLTLTLDKALYEEGETMTLIVTENVVKPARRTIAITDSAGSQWRKQSDDGRAPVFTALAGAQVDGENTVSATITRTPDGGQATATATYTLGTPVPPVPDWEPRFAGDREDRVMVGLAVTDKSNSNLQWEHALGLLSTAGAFVSVRRCFVPGWISKSNIDKWADWAEGEGVYPVISFKVPGNDWAGVAAGRFNSDLDLLISVLTARAAAGRAPVCVAVHHEPSGDGDLTVWARMQEFLSNRFAPSTDTFCFSTISNGYDWGPKNGGKGEVEQMYPRSLIETMNRNRHIIGCDTYDSADATKLDYTQYDRTSLKIQNFVAWAREEGVNLLGLGEFGCHNDIDLTKCWELIRDNSDLFGYACHFNSGQNSRADWRMTPNGYPPDPAVSSYVDRGGSAASAARLASGKQMFTASAVVAGA